MTPTENIAQAVAERLVPLKCNGQRCCKYKMTGSNQTFGSFPDNACGNRLELGWYCTLPRGHEGDHIACNSTTHDLKRWPNEND